MCSLRAQLRAAQEAVAAEREKNIELSHEIALAAENWAEREEEFNVLDNKLDAEREALAKFDADRQLIEQLVAVLDKSERYLSGWASGPARTLALELRATLQKARAAGAGKKE